VLDLRQLDFIDLSGLRLILTLDRDARNHGHEFVVIPGPPAIQRLFKLTGLSQYPWVQRPPNVNRQDHEPVPAPQVQRDATLDRLRLQCYIAELHGRGRRVRAVPSGAMRSSESASAAQP
jgi:hypothetical protein